jgi:hypothetical protein
MTISPKAPRTTKWREVEYHPIDQRAHGPAGHNPSDRHRPHGTALKAPHSRHRSPKRIDVGDPLH